MLKFILVMLFTAKLVINQGYDETVKQINTSLQQDSTKSDTTVLAWESKWGSQSGIATWYGSNGVKGIKHTDGYHGKRTANGETFDTWALTAAHLRLPFNTLVRVTNLSNDKSVIVRINDRGPYGNKSRIIDLSYKAKQEIGMDGIAKIKLERIKID